MSDGGSRPWQDTVEPDLRRRVLSKMYVLLRPTGLRLIFSPFFLYLSVRRRGIHGVKGPSAAVVGFEREREKGERESDGP
jgi:hypothetical protein